MGKCRSSCAALAVSALLPVLCGGCGAVAEPQPVRPALAATPVAIALPLPPAARRDHPVQDPGGAEPETQDPQAPAASLPELTPDLLLPAAAEDEVVATVGGTELRKSHVFDRLATIRPRLAMDVIDLLVLDLLVAEHAKTHRVTVDAAAIDDLVQREEKLLRDGIEAQLPGTVFEAYVSTNFAMDVAAFRELLRLRIAQRFFHDNVIRFMALREDRVRVRYIVNRDAALMQEVARKVADGADFGSLAVQHSEDDSRRDNGLLPPFGPGFEHPIASAAFALEAGEVSPVFTVEGAEGPRHYLVYCLERIPGRPDVTFASVADELRAGLRDAPRTDFETRAYVLRHSDRLERLGGVEIQPRSVLTNGTPNR